MSVHLGDSHDFSFLDKVRSQLDAAFPWVPYTDRVNYTLASWEDFQLPAYHYKPCHGRRLESEERIFAVSSSGECRLLEVPSLNLAPSAKVWQIERGGAADYLRLAIERERKIEVMFDGRFGAGEYLDSFECFIDRLKDVMGFPKPYDFWLGSVERQLNPDDRYIVHCELQTIRLGYVSTCQWIISLREILPNFAAQRRLGRIGRLTIPKLMEGEDTRTN